MKRGDSCNWVGNDCSKFLAFLTFFLRVNEERREWGKRSKRKKQTRYQKIGIVISCNKL